MARPVAAAREMRGYRGHAVACPYTGLHSPSPDNCRDVPWHVRDRLVMEMRVSSRTCHGMSLHWTACPPPDNCRDVPWHVRDLRNQRRRRLAHRRCDFVRKTMQATSKRCAAWSQTSITVSASKRNFKCSRLRRPPCVEQKSCARWSPQATFYYGS